MASDTENIIELLSFYKQYKENLTEEYNHSKFAVWLYNQHQKGTNNQNGNNIDGPMKDIKEELNEKFDFFFGSTEKQIGFMLHRLARFNKIYVKKMLEGSPFSSIEEFSFLLDVDHRGSPTKSEIINTSFMEYTTATEILNRLVKMKLLEQFIDSEDKRVRRLKITPKGKKLAYEAAKKMQLVSKVLIGNLSDNEKHKLIEILGQMDKTNLDINRNMQNADLEEIAKQYLFSD